MPPRRRLLLACAAVLAACNTQAAAPPPEGLQWTPVPASALSTRRDLRFVAARWAVGGQSVTLLAHQPEGGAPRPLARLLQLPPEAGERTSIQRLSLPGGAAPQADVELALLEQLYTLVFRSSPLAHYCLGADGDDAAVPCDASKEGVSHAGVLQALAALRERVAVRLPAAVPWRQVAIAPVPRQATDVDSVAVRVTGPAGPLVRQQIYFNRAPHSICVARADDQGLAGCRLEDQHGDGSQHSHAVDVVATYPGEILRERVLLPTTWVLPAPLNFAQPATLSGAPASRP